MIITLLRLYFSEECKELSIFFRVLWSFIISAVTYFSLGLCFSMRFKDSFNIQDIDILSVVFFVQVTYPILWLVSLLHSWYLYSFLISQ